MHFVCKYPLSIMVTIKLFVNSVYAFDLFTGNGYYHAIVLINGSFGFKDYRLKQKTDDFKADLDLVLIYESNMLSCGLRLLTNSL